VSLAESPPNPPYLAELVEEARRQELASDPYWRKLVHYVELDRRWRSAARGDFFLAANGRHDPEAELEATLSAFFDPPATGLVQHPQCRFIARRHWLDERLGFDVSRLPRQPCPDYDKWYETIDPDRVTLVFASAYVNNPASMYGHTLLRIDQPDTDRSGELVSYVLNYAATTDETNGIVFAVLGLTGGYLGEFSLQPYYDKVKEYNDLESRALWEYELAFTREETDRLLRHVWELEDVGFRYYFFLQNCSYRLLELLEVARPGLELTDGFGLWAIPTDTVREVLKVEGLLGGVAHRPGVAAELQYYFDEMTRVERGLTRDLTRGVLEPDDPSLAELAPERHARVLFVAYEYLRYLTITGKQVRGETAQRLRALLVARSEVPVSGPLEPMPMPEVRPDQGHPARRVELSAGGWDGQPFMGVKLRGAYHDLLDPQAGFQENAQINFMAFEFRRLQDDRTTRLERLDLIDIDSLAPRDAFFSPMSWNVTFGLLRQRIEDGSDPLVTQLEGGSSWAYRLGDGSSLVGYVGIQSFLQFDHELDRSWRLGAGPRMGLLADRGRGGRFQLEGQSLWLVDESRPQWKLSAEYRLPLGRRYALGARGRVEETFGETISELGAAFVLYF
jgi:hypothetical protein